MKKIGLVGIAALTTCAALYACNDNRPAQSVTIQNSSLSGSPINQNMSASPNQSGPNIPVSANVPITGH